MQHSIDIRKKIALLETVILHELESPGREICSCASKQAVSEDYRNVAEYFEKNVEYKHKARNIRNILKDIEKGKIIVTDDQQEHCAEEVVKFKDHR